MQEYIIFSGIALLIILTPGPDFILLLNNSLSHGFRKGLATSYGILFGQVVHITALLLGLSLLIAKSAFLFDMLKWLGAAYLAYLGLRSLLAKKPTDHKIDKVTTLKSNRHCFVEGVTSTVINPKVLLFYMTFLPQFIHVGENVAYKTIVLGTIFISLVVVWYVVFFTLIHRIEPWFKRGLTQLWLNRVSGVALLSISASLLVKKD